MRLPLIVLILNITLSATSPAQQPATVSGADSLPAQEEVVAAPERGPVAVPEPSEKAMRYYRSGNVLWFINTVWGLLIPALFLFTGFSARIRDWAQAIGRKWFFVIVVYLTLFLAINFLIDLPLDFYRSFVRQHAPGLRRCGNRWRCPGAAAESARTRKGSSNADWSWPG